MARYSKLSGGVPCFSSTAIMVESGVWSSPPKQKSELRSPTMDMAEPAPIQMSVSIKKVGHTNHVRQESLTCVFAAASFILDLRRCACCDCCDCCCCSSCWLMKWYKQANASAGMRVTMIPIPICIPVRSTVWVASWISKQFCCPSTKDESITVRGSCKKSSKASMPVINKVTEASMYPSPPSSKTCLACWMATWKSFNSTMRLSLNPLSRSMEAKASLSRNWALAKYSYPCSAPYPMVWVVVSKFPMPAVMSKRPNTSMKKTEVPNIILDKDIQGLTASPFLGSSNEVAWKGVPERKPTLAPHNLNTKSRSNQVIKMLKKIKPIVKSPTI